MLKLFIVYAEMSIGESGALKISESSRCLCEGVTLSCCPYQLQRAGIPTRVAATCIQQLHGTVHRARSGGRNIKEVVTCFGVECFCRADV